MSKSKKAIRSGKFKEVAVSLSFIALVLVFMPGPAYSQDSPAMTLITRIQKLEMRLAEIESGQDLILDKQKEIISKLDNLKIWVRRN